MAFFRNITSRLRLTGGPGDMPCHDVVEVVTSYLDGDLELALQERLEAHLATCPDCVLYIEQMRQTIEITGATADAQELPAELREHLQRAFDDWAQAGSAG